MKHIFFKRYIAATLTALLLFSSAIALGENGNGIEILNWSKYQSEYDRQKPYREKSKRHPEKTDPDKYIKGQYGDMVRR